jgi:Nucleotidyltransferase domain
MPLQPTHYPDVNSVLHDFLIGVQAILDAHFVGMYLYGSLTLGNFNPEASDIDFIVVTDAELSDTLFEALRLLHGRFDASGSKWAAKIEAAYIPRDVLHRDTPSTARYPQVEKGTTLVRDPLESGWSFQRLTLREHGVVVAGPGPRELITAADPNRRTAPAWPHWCARARSAMRISRAAHAIGRRPGVTSAPRRGWLEHPRVDPGRPGARCLLARRLRTGS